MFINRDFCEHYEEQNTLCETSDTAFIPKCLLKIDMCLKEILKSSTT